MNKQGTMAQWNKIKRLGRGGNSTVWRAKRHGGDECALKILKPAKRNEERYRRFVHEIEIQRSLNGHPGVLPILDAYLPKFPSEENRAWLAMPIAMDIRKALGKRPRLVHVVEAIVCIAGTLADLASKEISHRDIKPENLYRFRDSWVLGDFGLVAFPGKEPVTEVGRALGPRFYIAPEMVRKPESASGFLADVWSLAKTMWVLVAGQNFPPPGPQPSDDPQDCLAIITEHPRAYLLDKLIERATRNDSAERPTMRQFAEELVAWLALGATPPPPNDVSDLANRIRIASKPFYETRNFLQQSQEEAQQLSHRLLAEFVALGSQLAETGLRYNAPSESGQNLLSTSGFTRTEFGHYGVTVSIYTPSATAHEYDCGVMIQVLDDGRHRLYAAHRMCLHEQPMEVLWTESHEADSGSSKEEEAVRLLFAGLQSNLRPGLESFLKLVSENPPTAK
jgi:serine/threonine protein kinase